MLIPEGRKTFSRHWDKNRPHCIFPLLFHSKAHYNKSSMTREEFIFTIGYDGDDAVVDKL